jgi:hypothetical protein
MIDLTPLEGAYASMTEYSRTSGRPGLQDLITFDQLCEMYESDMSELEPYNVWVKTPDEIMQEILTDNQVFTIDFGWEDLWDSLRDYCTNKAFIVQSDDLEEDEYKQLLERLMK